MIQLPVTPVAQHDAVTATIYDLSTGRIERTVSCPAAELAAQYDTQIHSHVEGAFDDSAFYIEGGEAIAMPARPSASHIFDYALKDWIDPRTLADLKAAKNAQINAWRLAANRGTFTFSGKTIACDALSRSDIDGVNAEVTLTGALPAAFPGAWKAVDNTYLAIPDVSTWTAFVQAMVAQGAANFAHSEALKAALAAAITAAEVEDIVW